MTMAFINRSNRSFEAFDKTFIGKKLQMKERVH
ncbi:hypothetical protein SPHINGOT1_640005 [Sphingomonas sp. T1]|nr:hypothetical protein SPHINGOT1_640005 [Sphingomonas sp. T1]